jgi:hypothetical protein
VKEPIDVEAYLAFVVQPIDAVLPALFYHTTAMGEDLHRFVRHKMAGKMFLTEAGELSMGGFRNNFKRIFKKP